MSAPAPKAVAAAGRASIELATIRPTSERSRHGRHDSGYEEEKQTENGRDHSPSKLSYLEGQIKDGRDYSPSGISYLDGQTKNGREFSPPDISYLEGQTKNGRDQSRPELSYRSSIDTPYTTYPPTASVPSHLHSNAPGSQAINYANTSTTQSGISTPLDQSLHSLPDPLIPSTHPDDAHPTHSHLQSLKPVDGGRDAWMFLVGATVVEILVYGFSFSIGILHLYWTSMFGEASSGTVTLASTLQAGMLYMLLGIVGPMLAAWPRYSKHFQFGGLVIASAGLIGTAFITQPWHLIVTIGMLFPFATATYMPCCIILFEWFQAKRGLAAGIMYAGTGVGGTVFPFVISGLISRVGYRAAMCSIGVAFLILGSLALIPIKRRVPLPTRRKGPSSTPGASARNGTGADSQFRESAIAEAAQGQEQEQEQETMRVPRANLSFMKRPQVWIGAGIILVSSMGTFVPTLWLPSFADDLRVSPGGTGLISIMNAASVPGNTLIGYLSDRYPIHTVIIGNCLFSSLTCFFLWGFGTSAGTLVTFVLLFGLVGLSFAALWTRMLGLIARDDPTVPAVAFSIFAVGRGIGSVTSGPIADVLLKIDVLRGAAGGYGVKNYGILLIYTGASIMVAAAMGFAFTDKQRSR